MKVRIPRTSGDDDQADQDAPPWERDVPPGWHAAKVRDVVIDPFNDGDDDKLQVTYALKVGGQTAWIRQNFDLDDERDQQKLGKLGRAVGVMDGDDVDTDGLKGKRLEIRVSHGGPRDRAPYHWINVTGYRELDEAGDERPPQDPAARAEVEDLPF